MSHLLDYICALKEKPTWLSKWVHRPRANITPSLMAEYSMLSSETLDKILAAARGMNALSIVFAIILCSINLAALEIADKSIQRQDAIPQLQNNSATTSTRPTPPELPNWIYLFFAATFIPHSIFAWRSARAAMLYRKIKHDDPVQKEILKYRLNNPDVAKYLNTINRDNDLRELDARIIDWLLNK